LLLTPKGVITANVGDTEIFEIDDRGLVELSVPDNPVAPGWMGGGLTTSQVTQLVGGPALSLGVGPHLGRYPLEAGMRFLICSDGLTGAVPQGEIEAIVMSNVGSDHALLGDLVQVALAAGTEDDISVVLVAVAEPGE
jgi:serine/threonine protein phosphatase PrpC